MANRHLSRSIILQTLFEWDFSINQEGIKKEEIDIKDILKRNLSEFGPGLEDDVFMNSLLDAILNKKNIIDEIITKAAPEWPIDKISIVDRNILRIGLTELLFGDRKDVPPKVAINEAIELAKTFGGENSSKFVNGVLGSVYKEIGEPGKDETSKNKNKEEIDISKLEKERLGGALVYTIKKEKILFGLVHDVFNYWTLSKGKLKEDEDLEEGTKRKIKEEIGLDIDIIVKLGENEYVATYPDRGKVLKNVVYFLAKTEYKELELAESGGLDEARWFELKEIPELRIYKDIVPLITKAVEIISSDIKSES